MSSRDIHPDVPRRKALFVAVSALCAEAGFGKAENTAIETMTEMLQSCKYQTNKSLRLYVQRREKIVGIGQTWVRIPGLRIQSEAKALIKPQSCSLAETLTF